MPSPLQPQSIRNLGIYGVMRQAEVDDTLIPEGGLTDVSNMHFDRKGVATVRPGMVSLGSTAEINAPAYDCIALHNANSSVLLAAFIGGYVDRYPISGASTTTTVGQDWASLFNFSSASAKIRFKDFGGRTIMTNGVSSMQVNTDPTWYSTWGTTPGNPLNTNQFHVADRTASFIESYKSRVYLAGDTVAGRESRLYFSSVIDSAGNISWTPLIDFVDINPGDGENISALKRYSLELCVFKPNYLYRFRTIGLDPDPLIRIGTRSQESIIEGKRGLYFHHDTGFFRYSGDYPVEISRAISDIVNAIPFSQYDDIVSWKDTDHIYWSLGNITVSEVKQNVTIKNCVVRYTESSDVWTVYSYQSDIRAGGSFASPSTLTISPVVGFARTINGATFSPNRGVVAVYNYGVTDLGEPIPYRLVTKFYEWEGISNTKVVNEAIGICEKAQDMHVMYQTDDNLEWHEMGQLKSFITYFHTPTLPFNRIRFKVTGITKVEAAVFQGLEILSGINQGNLLAP